MSANHNRIKVADLETNEPNKILKTNAKGELEFSNIEYQKASSSYKIFTAILNQTGTNPPIATILENNMGSNIIFDYTSKGTYTGTLTNAFPEGKTFFITTAPNTPGSGNIFYIGRVDNNTITLSFRKNMTAFDEIVNAMMEIRVYQ